MAFYESVFIARQDISAAQAETIAKQFEDIIKKTEGTQVRTEMWGLRTLAYRVKKNRKGHYVMFQFEGTGATVTELERNYKINEDIIRFMTIKIDAMDTEPSVILSAREAA